MQKSVPFGRCEYIVSDYNFGLNGWKFHCTLHTNFLISQKLAFKNRIIILGRRMLAINGSSETPLQQSMNIAVVFYFCITTYFVLRLFIYGSGRESLRKALDSIQHLGFQHASFWASPILSLYAETNQFSVHERLTCRGLCTLWELFPPLLILFNACF